jgi:hypothetical protein
MADEPSKQEDPSVEAGQFPRVIIVIREGQKG